MVSSRPRLETSRLAFVFMWLLLSGTLVTFVHELTLCRIANRDITLLVGLQIECRKLNLRLPWERLTKYIGPKVTSSAIEQHVNKLGKRRPLKVYGETRKAARNFDSDATYEDGEDDVTRTRGNEGIANHYYNQDGRLYDDEEDEDDVGSSTCTQSLSAIRSGRGSPPLQVHLATTHSGRGSPRHQIGLAAARSGRGTRVSPRDMRESEDEYEKVPNSEEEDVDSDGAPETYVAKNSEFCKAMSDDGNDADGESDVADKKARRGRSAKKSKLVILRIPEAIAFKVGRIWDDQASDANSSTSPDVKTPEVEPTLQTNRSGSVMDHNAAMRTRGDPMRSDEILSTSFGNVNTAYLSPGSFQARLMRESSIYHRPLDPSAVNYGGHVYGNPEYGNHGYRNDSHPRGNSNSGPYGAQTFNNLQPILGQAHTVDVPMTEFRNPFAQTFDTPQPFLGQFHPSRIPVTNFQNSLTQTYESPYPPFGPFYPHHAQVNEFDNSLGIGPGDVQMDESHDPFSIRPGDVLTDESHDPFGDGVDCDIEEFIDLQARFEGANADEDTPKIEEFDGENGEATAASNGDERGQIEPNLENSNPLHAHDNAANPPYGSGGFIYPENASKPEESGAEGEEASTAIDDDDVGQSDPNREIGFTSYFDEAYDAIMSKNRAGSDKKTE